MPEAEVTALPSGVVQRVDACVRALYVAAGRSLPFHGWHHIAFVREKAVEFAGRNGADRSLVEVAALVHDLNYLDERDSVAAAGRARRQGLLRECGVPDHLVHRIEAVVTEAETHRRDADISLEAQALSDADTLFKALPITPVMLSHRYLAETGVDLPTLAKKVVSEQVPLAERGIYFYDQDAATRYAAWSGVNLRLWQAIVEAVQEPAVRKLLDALD